MNTEFKTAALDAYQSLRATQVKNDQLLAERAAERTQAEVKKILGVNAPINDDNQVVVDGLLFEYAMWRTNYRLTILSQCADCELMRAVIEVKEMCDIGRFYAGDIKPKHINCSKLPNSLSLGDEFEDLVRRIVQEEIS